MKCKIDRFAFSCLVLAALGWLGQPIAAHAQASRALALEQRADHSIATSGDRLTFTFILTNTGGQALTGLIVNDSTPTGATFFGASAPRGWLMTTPPQNGSGAVVWRSTAPLQPNDRVELQLIVNVQETNPIVSPGFSVSADQLSQPMTSSSITVAVQPKINEAVSNFSIGWLAIIIVSGGLMIGAWRWTAVHRKPS